MSSRASRSSYLHKAACSRANSFSLTSCTASIPTPVHIRLIPRGKRGLLHHNGSIDVHVTVCISLCYIPLWTWFMTSPYSGASSHKFNSQALWWTWKEDVNGKFLIFRFTGLARVGKILQEWSAIQRSTLLRLARQEKLTDFGDERASARANIATIYIAKCTANLDEQSRCSSACWDPNHQNVEVDFWGARQDQSGRISRCRVDRNPSSDPLVKISEKTENP